MGRLILFSDEEWANEAYEFQNNDPNLALNGMAVTFASAIAVTGNWTLFDDVDYQGQSIDLIADGGPDSDGVYKDPGDWGGATGFNVRSIQYS